MQGPTPKKAARPNVLQSDEEIRTFPVTAERRLAVILGTERAKEVVRRCLVKSCGGDPRNPQDLMRFAEALIDEGGIVAAVGRTIKIYAVLRGARGGDGVSAAPASGELDGLLDGPTRGGGDGGKR